MTTPQLPPLPEQSMTHHITDEQILTEAQSRMGASAVERIGTSAVIGTVRAVLALAAPQGEPMTDTERADMICAVAAICTGTSSRNLAATAIEWTERRYGITAPAGGEQPAAHQATKQPR